MSVPTPDDIPPAEALAAETLAAEALALRELNATVIDAPGIGIHAIEYALHRWEVFPLNGKIPAIPNPHPRRSRDRQTCKGECGRQGHGVKDATTDLDTIIAWWSGRYRGANIGGRVPHGMFVLDIDPRAGGLGALAAKEARHGKLPNTLTTISGRGDGGAHLFFRRPPGPLSAKRLPPGFDLKTHAGYSVLAPSIHPDTGKPYQRIDRAVAVPPAWLVELLTPQPAPAPPAAPVSKYRRPRFYGTSPADHYTATTSWAEILSPHGWTCLDADPDADGARWLHPAATSECSATVNRGGHLFVWSTNTLFDVSADGDPHGYTKFRAYAILNHRGDMKAAARALKGMAA